MNNPKSRILAHSFQAIERLRRHRWIAAGLGSAALLGMMTAFATAPSADVDRVQLQTVLEQLATPAIAVADAESPVYLHEEFVRRSDTIHSLTARLGISDQDALAFILKSEKAQAISRQLRPGKAVTAKTGEHGELLALYFPLNGSDSMVSVERRGNGFVATEEALRLEQQTVVKSGEIHSSLFGATDALNIPDAIATQLAEIFAGDIDFYRDLRKGDKFSLVYETFTHCGQPVRSGHILAAEFINDQTRYTAYWFQSEDGKGGYYTADGKPLRKAFLRSPLEFSRVTSGFTTARFHPVLQTWRAHKGVDYGAPTGTPVRTVADGTVEFAGHQGGYGNLVILKHQGVYSTAYGHLSGFAAGMRKGLRVHQGDTIGFVGQTGLATGPHLHYEFRVNSQPVNPLAVKLPESIPLEATQISRFRESTGPLRAKLELAKQINLAMAK